MPYPEQAELMRDLVLNDHTVLEDTPLCLAIYFQSRHVPYEECVFEVLHHFGLDEVSEERSFFQIQFGRTPNFPLPEGDRLRLILTNPTEMVYAIRSGWSEIYDLSLAMNAGRCEVIYERPDDADTQRVLSALTNFRSALIQDAVPA